MAISIKKNPALSNSPETSPIFGEQQFLVHLLPTRNVESNHVRAFFELHCAAWLVQTCTVHWKEHGSLLIFTMICGHLWAWVRMGVPNLMTKSMVPRFGILTDTVLIFPWPLARTRWNICKVCICVAWHQHSSWFFITPHDRDDIFYSHMCHTQELDYIPILENGHQSINRNSHTHYIKGIPNDHDHP